MGSDPLRLGSSEIPLSDLDKLRREIDSFLKMIDADLGAINGKSMKSRAAIETEKIIDAIYGSDWAEVDRLVQGGAGLDVPDEGGLTPLMCAVVMDRANPKMVKKLIELGANINQQDPNQGYTALHFAARDQQTDIAKILLEHGAQVDTIDAWGNTPLWRCVMGSKSPSRQLIEILLRAGANPKRKNKHGVSPVDLAEGDPAMKAVLLGDAL